MSKTALEPAENKPRQSIGARRNPATEQAILDAAEALLMEKGLAGFSIEAVARRARAGKPTIYRWWPNKTSLLLAVYHRQKPQMYDPDTGNIENNVALFLENLLGYWRDTRGGPIFRSIVAEAQSDPDAEEALQAYTRERQRQCSEMFRKAIARGELRADADPVIAAEMLSALAWKRVLTGQLETGHAEMRRIAHQLVAGLLP